LWRSERIGTLQAMGLTLLLVVALGPVVQPWYLSWGLVLLAPVATGRIRSLIIGLSVTSAFIGLPGGQKLAGLLLHADPLQIAVALLVCLGILTVPLTPLQRQRLLVHWRRRGRPGPPRGETAPELDYLGV
jgi:alpha-1,6-mannosyltransferase